MGRETQPYRNSGSRAPSQVLDKMRAGRAAGGAPAQTGGGSPRKSGGIRVPLIVPRHKRPRAL